ncbi:MAG: lectin [Thermomonas sp.]
MTRSLLSLAMIAALAACTSQRDASTDPAAAPPVADQPAEDIPPATMPMPASLPTPASTDMPAPAADGADTQAGFAGYGDVKFGTAAADMEKSWGGELKALGKDANPSCYFMAPKWVKSPSEFAFMIGDGKFVRYGTDSAKFVAPGGGKVGMATQELQALYHGALQSTPHKYVEGGQVLSIAASGVSPAKLVFETDAAGKATAWRVGLSPQVDYVEGCS